MIKVTIKNSFIKKLQILCLRFFSNALYYLLMPCIDSLKNVIYYELTLCW